MGPVIISIFAAIVAGFLIYNFLRNRKVRQEGIETEAFVSRIEERESYDADTGAVSVTYDYYVIYTDKNGSRVEAILGNGSRKLTVGERLMIKYLPEKPKYALRIKQ